MNLDLTKMTVVELESLAYKIIREQHVMTQNLQMVENERANKIQATTNVVPDAPTKKTTVKEDKKTVKA